MGVIAETGRDGTARGDIGPAGGEADDPIAAAARRTACHMVKARARHYMRRPMALEALHPSLSVAAPRTLIAIAEHLVQRETHAPRRWFGFGGEVSLVNARAALLLGRTERRREVDDGRSIA